MFEVLCGLSAYIYAYCNEKASSLPFSDWFWKIGTFLSTERAQLSVSRGKRAAGEDRREHGGKPPPQLCAPAHVCSCLCTQARRHACVWKHRLSKGLLTSNLWAWESLKPFGDYGLIMDWLLRCPPLCQQTAPEIRSLTTLPSTLHILYFKTPATSVKEHYFHSLSLGTPRLRETK